jgi:hypothetical protein
MTALLLAALNFCGGAAIAAAPFVAALIAAALYVMAL